MTRWDNLPKKYQKKNESKKVYEPECGEKEAKLIIPGELPTMNEIINKSKTHWAEYRKMKESYDEIVSFYATQQRIKFFKSVKLEITYYRKDKRTDPDNIVVAKKIILDGLVQAGVLEDDNWSIVKGFKESWEVDKKSPRTEIILKEV